MSRVSNILALIVAGIGLCASPLRVSAEPEDRVCKTPGPCRTNSIVRGPGSSKFVLHGSFAFEPLPHWIERHIVEDGGYLRFVYDRPDESTACGLTFFYFGGVEPGFDGTWDLFIGRAVERGDAKIITEARDDARPKRVAIVAYDKDETMQVELRTFENTDKGRIYELAVVGVAPTTTISKTLPDMLACHVRPAAV